MTHYALPAFWQHYQKLPIEIQRLADKNFALLKSDPLHPSLHFKKIGGKTQAWSVRVGRQYRALGREAGQTIHWFWIGPHATYDGLLK